MSPARASCPLSDQPRPGLVHLVRRFFGVLFARPLSREEVEEVGTWLGPDLMRLFTSQQVADQRHGLEVARHVARSGRTDSDLFVAATLHDVGKRHSAIGAMRRSVATVLMLLKLPATRRLRLYLEHGELGAADLEGVGAPRVAIEFARHHQHGRPEGFPLEDWAVLRSADLNR